MGWGKALSAVIVMSISVMLVVSVLPVGADPGEGKRNAPLMFRSGDTDCSLGSNAKCAVYIDTNHNDRCDSDDKMIMLPAKVALGFKPCPPPGSP